LYEINGDPNGPASATIEDLKVEASGADLTYQWYKKATNKNAADMPVATTRTYKPVVTAWGMNSYYCVVSNAYGSVKSNVADVAIGCGAKTVTGGWLKFMCYNLGATDRSKDPFIYDDDILGSFYQWGRPVPTDRTEAIPANFIVSSVYPNDWKMPYGYSTDFSDSYRQDDYLWRNYKADDKDPCPDGWHVPSQSAFEAIFKGTADADIPANSTANTWTPTGNWASSPATPEGNPGYAIMPDGIITTLFFPAAGCRRSWTGGVVSIGWSAVLWTSTTSSSAAINAEFARELISPSRTGHRAAGMSVRCIQE
jgi:uncharacterized protein (TIGR02145 family)